MNISIVGGGCLGLPLALAYNLKGHNVWIYDKNADRMDFSWFNEKEKGPNGEDNFYELLNKSSIKFVNLEKLLEIDNSFIFILINTNNPEGHGDEITHKRYPYETKHIESFFDGCLCSL